MPEIGRYNQYYALKDDPEPNNNIVYRAKCDGREFKEWERTYITTADIEGSEPLPSPPFPSPRAMPIAGKFQFADLKVEYGTEATLWTGHPDEIYGKNFKLDGTGFYIYSGQNQMFIDEDEIMATYNKETIFQITEELTKLKNLIAGQATIAGLTIKPQVVNGRNLIIIY